MAQKPVMQIDNVYGFPKHQMQRYIWFVDNYFLIRDNQGKVAANDYVQRSVPKQMRVQIVNMINARMRING